MTFKESWMRTSRNWCNISAGLFCLFVVAPFSYLLMDRQPPMTYESGYVIPPAAAPGDEVTVYWVAHVDRTCVGTVYRKMIDSQGTVWDFEPSPSTLSHLPRPIQLKRTFYIPWAAALGPARYRVTVKWVCNPIHNWWPITVDTPTLSFIIAPKKE